MKTLTLISSCVIILYLGACSPKHTDEKPEGVLTEVQKQTLKKSKETEELLQKTNEERMKQVDETPVD